MRKNTESTTREALAHFLRRRRDALSPEVVGLRAAGQRRRTPGLRRDEVAQLANMSTTYYERLEQGRGPQPSAAILAGLSQALQLAPDERAYLYLLAGQAEAPAAQPDGVIDRRLLSVMRAVAATVPALVGDGLGTIAAQNELSVILFGALVGLPGREGNVFWRWFASKQLRGVVLNSPEHQEAISHYYVASLRFIVAERGYDAASAELVADLRAASTEFSRIWEEHPVCTSFPPVISMLDHRVGRLDFDLVLMVGQRSRHLMYSLHATPGTPTQQRLTRLVELTEGQRAISTYRRCVDKSADRP